MAGEKFLRIRYAGDTSGVTKALGTIDKQHKSFGSKIKSSIGGIGKGLLGSFFNPVTGAVVGLGIAFNEAAEAAKGMAQTKAVLKSTGGAANVTEEGVSKLADQLGRMAVVDNDVVREGENMLLTFTGIRNEVGKGNDIFNQATLAALDMSTAMGTDMTSASMQIGKALNDPLKGLTALTRVGVMFTDQQRKQIAAMVEHGNVAGAQKVILAELSKEFGGSAKASGKAASPLRKLAVLGLDLAEKIGTALIPILDALVPVIAFVIEKALVPVLTVLSTLIRFVVSKAGPALKAFGRGFMDVFRGIRSFMTPVINGILGAVEFLVNKVIAGVNGVIAAINLLPGVDINKLGYVHFSRLSTGSTAPNIGTTGGNGVRYFAEGGIVRRPTLAMLGESGPEAVVPLGRSRGLGNVTINVYGSVIHERDLAESIRRELLRTGRRNGGIVGLA